MIYIIQCYQDVSVSQVFAKRSSALSRTSKISLALALSVALALALALALSLVCVCVCALSRASFVAPHLKKPSLVCVCVCVCVCISLSLSERERERERERESNKAVNTQDVLILRSIGPHTSVPLSARHLPRHLRAAPLCNRVASQVYSVTTNNRHRDNRHHRPTAIHFPVLSAPPSGTASRLSSAQQTSAHARLWKILAQGEGSKEKLCLSTCTVFHMRPASVAQAASAFVLLYQEKQVN